MRAFVVGLLLFLGWWAFARYVYVNQIRGNEGDKSKNHLAPTSGTSPRRTVVKNLPTFDFEPNSNRPVFTVENGKTIYRLVEHLKKHPDDDLVVVGFYQPSPNSGADSIAIKRALIRASHIRSAFVREGIGFYRVDTKAGKSKDPTRTIGFVLER